MKSLRYLPLVLTLSLSTLVLAQSEAKQTDAPKAEAPKSEAQKSFDQLKTLAGSWEGPVTVDPPHHGMKGNMPTQVTLRVTSMGNLPYTRQSRSSDRTTRSPRSIWMAIPYSSPTIAMPGTGRAW